MALLRVEAERKADSAAQIRLREANDKIELRLERLALSQADFTALIANVSPRMKPLELQVNVCFIFHVFLCFYLLG